MKRQIRRTCCPICGEQLFEYGSKECYSAHRAYNKETMSKCPQSELIIERGKYHLEPHFKVEARDGVSHYETFFIYPYVVQSYDDVSNIYIFLKDKYSKKFLMEVPYLDLPWNNKEKVLNKLKLYTLFS